ncbi:MAG: rhamnulokinase [Treponema sp.]|jgi:rhamnulokinase|nr:rhamnulokinase [Treponema sp.]
MEPYYLAVDIGASGGRHILGHVERGQLILEEVHRFSNAPLQKDSSLIWDDDLIFHEIVTGLVKCGSTGKIPCSVGIDTWGVDYVLADREGAVIKPVYAYRDSRTKPFLKTALPFADLYSITGTAHQPFNTIYQVLTDKASGRLDKAEYFLALPEYFSQRLTGSLAGKEHSEYTWASTSGLLDIRKKNWSEEIFQKADLPRRLFKPVREPPYLAGELSRELRNQTGFNTRVVMIASHDTASAVSVTAEDSLYISSGTWSLLGIQGEPVLTAAAREAGYTNEGALNGRIRFLKNIMGLWVLQRIRDELAGSYSFADLESLAREAEPGTGDWFIDINLPLFLNPPSMIGAVRNECKRTGQKIPETPGELALCIYLSLARSYKNAIDNLEQITGKTYPSVSIIGGGSKDGYLNSLTARYTGKPVIAGPAEATAIGNLLLQMRYAGEPAVNKGFAELVSGFQRRNFEKIST